MQKPKSVEEYIAGAPKETQAKLKQLRALIKSIAPHALEKISYGMPYYGYKGRLAYFSYAKAHIGLYLTPPIMQLFKKELEHYSTSTATIRFPLKEELPVRLIQQLIKARVKLNNEMAKKKP